MCNEICDMEAFGGNIRDSIQTPFRDLTGDSASPDLPFQTGIVIMLHCDNLGPPGGPTTISRLIQSLI
jgi:hypothetical protein